MSELWAAFWFFLPAGIANISPVFTRQFPIIKHWNTPVDFGLSSRGKRLLGDNKSWRGVIMGALVAGLVGLFQYKVITNSAESTVFIFSATAAMGFGALFGDSAASFFKRRAGVSPGDSWFPFDQIDYILGGIVFVSFFVSLTLADIARIIIIYFLLHLVVSYLGYKVGLKTKPI